jgi:histidinol-phosphate/aromatic aminotransferase/cobyric acid decarboxylase-like protein
MDMRTVSDDIKFSDGDDVSPCVAAESWSTEGQAAPVSSEFAPCFHGGAFFDGIGDGFETLDRRREVINADVLDAWFPPSPLVEEALREHLPWLLRTSPPTGCEGMLRAIAKARGVNIASLLPGAGSSDLIFRAFRQWLDPDSRVLLLDPTYGEYAHVLENVIGCRVDRFTLSPEEDFDLPVDRFEEVAGRGYDLIVLVNPNSPTGRHVPRVELAPLLGRLPVATRVWIDETYIDYVGADESFETTAANSRNIVVCKSMSKGYALSGARVAYLCGPEEVIDDLRLITPPWVVELPSQVAAVKALEDRAYYERRHRETHELRDELASGLSGLGWTVVPGCANFLLCRLPDSGCDAATLVERCRAKGLFLRDASNMGAQMGDRRIRIAVKGAAENRRAMAILREALRG